MTWLSGLFVSINPFNPPTLFESPKASNPQRIGAGLSLYAIIAGTDFAPLVDFGQSVKKMLWEDAEALTLMLRESALRMTVRNAGSVWTSDALPDETVRMTDGPPRIPVTDGAVVED